MRDDLARPVFDILLLGIKLRERVLAGEKPMLGTEQAKLKAMLGSANTPAPWGSESDPTHSIANRDREFLGLRYTLTCWLDEILIEAGWKEWDENKLESNLFRTNIRYGNFWQQAHLAEAIPATADALEVFLLCVLLGFRGEYGENPSRLREWVDSTRSRVSRGMNKELAPLPEQTPVSNVPLLLGVEAYRKMTQRLVVGMLFAIPVVVFLIVYKFG